MTADEINRRDFLNGMLLAAGGAAVVGFAPLRALAPQAAPDSCDGSIGLDPRALRGGNLPEAFRVAHWMRDRRLTFAADSVRLAAGCDSDSGTFPIVDDGGAYDVIVAGSGVAGLSTAYYLRELRPETRVLIL